MRPSLQNIVVLCLYGHPESHSAEPTNECLLRDVISCASGMTCPAIVCGDLNETLRSSAALTSCERLGMTHVSPNTSTTRIKNGEVMKGEAIDHILVNRHALHYFPTSTVLYHITLSDHFPLTLSLMLPRAQSFTSMKWPMPAKLLRVIEACPYEYDQSLSFDQWIVKIKEWIRQSCHALTFDKKQVQQQPWKPKKVKIDLYFLRIKSAMAAAREVQLWGTSTAKLLSLTRKFRALKCKTRVEDVGIDRVVCMLETQLNRWIDKTHAQMIKEWKIKVQNWKPLSKEAYDFVKNPYRQKAVVVLSEGNIISHPKKMEQQLLAYWHDLESWSDSDALQRATLFLEDIYSIYVPHNAMWAVPDGNSLHQVVQK